MISIGFSTTKSMISRLVRWFTGSTASHSLVIFDWLDQKWVIASEWDGVKIVTLDSFIGGGGIIVKTFDTTLSMDELKPLLNDLGMAYDYTGLFGAIFPIIGRWFKKKWHNPWDNAQAVFCSEVIVMWLQGLKFKAVEGVLPADITPQTLMELLSASA